MSKLKTFLTGKDLSVTLGADRRSSLTAMVFVVALCAFEAFYFRGSFKELLGFFETADSPVFWAICLGYVIASVYLLFLFVLITLSSRWYYKAALVAFFSFAVFAQFGYANALGRFMIAQDLVSAFSATSEQKIDSVFAYSSYLSLLPGLALAILSVFSKPAARIFGGGAFSGLECLVHQSAAVRSKIRLEFRRQLLSCRRRLCPVRPGL